MASLYRITPQGVEVLRNLDVRQMVGQPGYFGSFGFSKWTGVGEAKPIVVMHELNHSYWGAFPIAGLPELSWKEPPGGGISAALERYHQDVVAFMAQPPDDYELLRQRLRLLPKLSQDNTDPLFHTVEADMVFTVGGDLALLPPILQKYWLNFLAPGPFHTWHEALGWYQTLEPGDRSYAGRFLVGFEHFDLGRFQCLEPQSKVVLDPGLAELIRSEERQRLQDFVEQFDLLLKPEDGKPNFKFWRGYLGDKLNLHGAYPELIPSLGLPRAGEIGKALDFLTSLDGKSSQEKAQLVQDELRRSTLLVFFLPVLDNATLLTLFLAGVDLSSEATLGGLAEFIELLEELTPLVDRIIEKGKASPEKSANELATLQTGVNFEEQKEGVQLFFDLLREADHSIAAEVVSALDNELLRRLLVPIPVTLRFILEPHRLLAALDITEDASAEDVAEGITFMMLNTSGNYRIDEPFVDQTYRVVAARGAGDPAQTLGLIADATFPMERFILDQGEDAARILAADLEVTTDLVRSSDTALFPPPRFIYRLIAADPSLAARVVQRLESRGERALVLEALAYFAYDARRLAQVPALPISLESDGRFLAHLTLLHGNEWLEARVREAADLYRDRSARGDAPAGFVEAYRQTLEAAVTTVEDVEARRALEVVIEKALG